ncbi:copper-binding protein [Sphingosinicella humi]|uniref:Copper-binding protein n=1 Tax=Allosphingosinicella humi TaxID=2068657 RepID=A0A2U2J6N4_9SPHN|nr:copper-binding protein [Sphingosinicella humi]
MRNLLALPLLLLAPAQPDWSQAQTLTVNLSNYDFDPERLQLQSGRPYRLHLVNTSSDGHNFAAPNFFRAATIAPGDRERVKKGKVEVHAGETADIRLVAPAAGEYKLHCSHFMHGPMGMKGKIVVQ